MANLIDYMLNYYGDELIQETPRFVSLIDQLRSKSVVLHPTIRRAADGKDGGAIDIEDFKILYLLVRTFKPKVVFEIGTWIGTSAMVIAEAMKKNDNDGKLYTCDINDYYTLGSRYDDQIIRINKMSDEAITEIPKSEIIDFVFADGELTFATIKLLRSRINTQSIIATHDYLMPAEKGVLNLVRMQLKSGFKYNSYSRINTTNYHNIDSCIGILLSDTLLNSINLRGQYYGLKLLETIHLGVNATISKIYKKFSPF